ncbi:MAG: PAS domain S-box protein [Acetobacteraceae bacterium]
MDYAIYMLDPEGRVVSWNPGAERIKGYAANEIGSPHGGTGHSARDCPRHWPMADAVRSESA